MPNSRELPKVFQETGRDIAVDFNCYRPSVIVIGHFNREPPDFMNFSFIRTVQVFPDLPTGLQIFRQGFDVPAKRMTVVILHNHFDAIVNSKVTLERLRNRQSVFNRRESRQIN